MSNEMTRRAFLASTTAAAAAMSVVGGSAAKADTPTTPPVCVFSKHLQFLDYDALAKTCKELGLDGVDLTVRAGGHVLPENVAVDLPRAVDAVRGQGLDVPMITTRLNNGDDPDARPIFEAASKLGIKYARIGGHRYDGEGAILPQLEAFTEQLRGLVKIAEDFDVTLGYHNHSGFNNVGAALWDLHRVYETIGLDHFGSNLDAGHVTVEGAYGAWQINTRLIAPHVKMMAVKDFVWAGERPRWVPLGEGIVDTAAVLKIVRTAGFAGPISMHFEYKVPSHDAMIEEVGNAAGVLRDALEQAGYV